jgi:D-cysteine desulfhydrase
MPLNRPEAADFSSFPRKPLALLPTPLVELPRLAAALDGPRIFMKRDDQTGLATGGNKARKLEFLVGDALARGCDALITGGASQSNHCRQTAAAAAACGLECHLVLGGEEPRRAEGNFLLDLLLGARVHWAGARRKGEDIPAIAGELRAAGRRPYESPYGGSSPLGAIGFAAAAGELAAQLEEAGLRPSRIVFASSSGGTQAGLMVGARLFGLKSAVTGICIDKAADEGIDFADRVLAIANGAAALVGLGERAFVSEDAILRREFTGDGYGVVGELERRAIGLLARTEGVLVDPVYSGRALGALISMIEADELAKDEAVLFWHTGGTPALFAYSDSLAEKK